jgi:hypothetical protein
MQPAWAPFSRRMRVSLRVSMLGDRDHAAANQELRQRLGGAPAAVQQRQVTDDEPRRVDRVRLEVLGFVPVLPMCG